MKTQVEITGILLEAGWRIVSAEYKLLTFSKLNVNLCFDADLNIFWFETILESSGAAFKHPAKGFSSSRIPELDNLYQDFLLKAKTQKDYNCKTCSLLKNCKVGAIITGPDQSIKISVASCDYIDSAIKKRIP